jgi:hypothetical protein
VPLWILLVNFGYDVVVYGKLEVAGTGFLGSLGILLWGAPWYTEVRLLFPSISPTKLLVYFIWGVWFWGLFGSLTSCLSVIEFACFIGILVCWAGADVLGVLAYYLSCFSLLVWFLLLGCQFVWFVPLIVRVIMWVLVPLWFVWHVVLYCAGSMYYCLCWFSYVVPVLWPGCCLPCVILCRKLSIGLGFNIWFLDDAKTLKD